MRSLTTIRLGDASLLWQAEPESGEPPFAVKLLRPSPDTGRPDEVGLWEEFSATDGVQPLLFSGVTDEGRPYAVTELRPEGDYGQALARGEHLSVDEVVAAGEAVAGALAAMHAAGFLHHAVRPDHILHGEPGPALVDFGSALPLDHPFPPVYYTRRDLHHTPPEELRGEAPSPASDVFRLASTLWTLLDGRPPFDPDADGEEPLSEYRDRILSAAVGDMRREDVPEWLRAVLRRALDPDPALRTATAEEFAAALAARQGPLSGEAPESADGDGPPEGADEAQEPRAAVPDADDGYPEEAEGAAAPEAEGAQGADEAQETPEPRATTSDADDGYPDEAEAETAPLAAEEPAWWEEDEEPHPLQSPAARADAASRAESAPDPDADDGYPDEAEAETAPLPAEEPAWWEEDEEPQSLPSPATGTEAAARTDSDPDSDDDGYPDDGYPDDDTSAEAGVPGTLRARRAAVLPEADGPGPADQEETEPLGALGTASGPARPDSGTSATGAPRPPAPPRPSAAATGPSTAPTAAYSAPAPSTGTEAGASASTTPLSPSTAPAAAHTTPAPGTGTKANAPAPTAPLSGSPAPTRRDPGPAPAPPFRPSPAPRPTAPPAPAFGTGGPDRFAPPYPDLAPEPPRERRFGALVGPVLVGLLAVVVVVAGITVLVRGMGGDDSPSASPEAGSESSGGPEAGASAPPADDPAVALAPADVALTDDLVAVSLTWTDNTGGESAHVVVGGPADTRGTSMARTEAGESSVEISGLNPEVEYCFQVVAVHSTEVLAPSEEVCTDRAAGDGA
ncbi:serine/threonine protein kinase [Nocardiopsis sp. NPDC006139]|uniref:protein kinase domain-containing protein n=1 Tax=Nocardiopsis sp. NPDC006139 TaxID=3154578 RepID=UPI00339DCF92